MTPEAQRIAIAEACGMRDVRLTSEEEVDIDSRSITYWSGLTGLPTGKHEKRIRVPDYVNDLNAMHEAEKRLTEKQLQTYLDILADAPRESMYQTWTTSVFATAAQRAEAFLRTIGKWEESND